MEVLEVYEPFKVLRPDRWCTRDESIVETCGWLKWNLYKLLPWFKVNPFHGHLLVELNQWTRPRHLEEDYFRTPSSDEVWNGLKETLNTIARS